VPGDSRVLPRLAIGRGNLGGAQDASGKAKRFAIWAAIAWAVIAVLYGILIAVGFANFNFNTGTSSSGF